MKIFPVRPCVLNQLLSADDTSVIIVVVCCLTGFNGLFSQIWCRACVWGVSRWKKKKCQWITYWGIMSQLAGWGVEKTQLVPSSLRSPVPTLRSVKCCSLCQVPVKRNYRQSLIWPVFLLIWWPAAAFSMLSFIIRALENKLAFLSLFSPCPSLLFGAVNKRWRCSAVAFVNWCAL